MASERLKGQIDRLLDEAEQGFVSRDWAAVRRCAQDVLAFDPDNPDAIGLLAGAERALGTEIAITGISPGIPTSPASQAHPTSFANGRYQVQKFLGEGGKKKVYLAHDTLLDCEVAFALINDLPSVF